MTRITTSVFIGLSLDGFIARPDGSLDWLTGSGEGGGEDFGYQAFMDSVDVLVLGRHTYETVLAFERWYYGDKPVVVLASQPVAIPDRLARTVEWMAGTPAEILGRLAERGMRHVYVDGGVTIQRFLADGLIDRMTLSRLPVLIGQGIPLFGSLPRDVRLRHVDTRVFAGGMVQSVYEVPEGTRGGGKVQQ